MKEVIVNASVAIILQYKMYQTSTYTTQTYKLLCISHISILKRKNESSQDGGIDGGTLPPHTTKRRTTTNLKTKKPKVARKSNCMEG